MEVFLLWQLTPPHIFVAQPHYLKFRSRRIVQGKHNTVCKYSTVYKYIYNIYISLEEVIL